MRQDVHYHEPDRQCVCLPSMPELGESSVPVCRPASIPLCGWSSDLVSIQDRDNNRMGVIYSDGHFHLSSEFGGQIRRLSKQEHSPTGDRRGDLRRSGLVSRSIVDGFTAPVAAATVTILNTRKPSLGHDSSAVNNKIRVLMCDFESLAYAGWLLDELVQRRRMIPDRARCTVLSSSEPI